MMKTIAAYALFTLCAFSAFAQGAGMKQYKSIDGKDWVCTTSAVSLVASEAALRLAGDLAGSNNVSALSGTVTALSGGVTASNILFNTWFAGLFSETNKWMAAYGWGNWAGPVASNTAAIAVLQTNTLTRVDGLAYVTKEAFSTNRITRWYDPELPTRWAEWDGGTNIVIYKVSAVPSGTNYSITYSSGFRYEYGETIAYPPVTNVFPYTNGLWFGNFTENTVRLFYDTEAWDTLLVSGFPAYLDGSVLVGTYGTATVSIASYTYPTNVEWRYFLPTNAIPPELANLDNLQGWLNNLYAGKAAFDGHVTDGAHTNVVLVGAVTLTNATSFAAGSYFGTNGVFFTRDGTNNWILF